MKFLNYYKHLLAKQRAIDFLMLTMVDKAHLSCYIPMTLYSEKDSDVRDRVMESARKFDEGEEASEEEVMDFLDSNGKV